MQRSILLTALFVFSLVGFLPGCGSDGNTVVQPTEDYQLTDQEQKNREREQEMLREQTQ